MSGCDVTAKSGFVRMEFGDGIDSWTERMRAGEARTLAQEILKAADVAEEQRRMWYDGIKHLIPPASGAKP